ncbi:MAG: hypothetical protein K0S41_384 [Anaerocolumna sp.]|jgi:N-acetylmuramoyl-L-alanine amidase|nr:hypothetical protein [Anaerocolumna sp.]
MDEQKLLKNTAINSFVLMLMVVIMSTVYTHNNNTLIYAENDSGKIPAFFNDKKDNDEARNDNMNNVNQEVIVDKLGDKYLIIKKTNATKLNVNLEDLYMERSISLTIGGLSKDSLDELTVIRVDQGKEFIGQPIAAKDLPKEQSKDEKTAQQANNEKLIQNTSNDLSINQSNDVNNDTNNDLKNDSNKNPNEELLVPEIITASGNILSMNDVVTTENAMDPVKDFNIQYKQEANSELYTAILYISLDDIYAQIVYQDNENIYIDLKRPKDVYKKIIVIDAGHGGKDSGTYSRDERNYEKDVNLSIILKLKEILNNEDIKVYYTRTKDETLFLNPRVNFANDVEADLFLSVHCNASESPEPYGSEVLYNELDSSEDFNSKMLAEICFKEIKSLTNRVNRGLVEGSEMVIIGKAKMPVALAEIGFMSNQQDLNFLLDENNQKQIAAALHRVIIRSFEEIERK